MRDKIFILFYGYTDWMETNFYSIGVKPNNCKILSRFLTDNIEVIRERDSLYEDNQDNNSISFQVNEFPDESPEFLYGEFYSKFIADSMRYPEAAIKNNIGGKVVLRFIINEDGSPENVQIKEGEKIGYGIPEEAIRLVESMKWKPAKKNYRSISISAEKTIIFRPRKTVKNIN
jgi:TonB family protein